MTDRQRNTHIATIRSPAEGELSVHVARWPATPTLRPALVMWRDGGRCDYLPPAATRRFAAALVEAAEQAEREEASR